MKKLSFFLTLLMSLSFSVVSVNSANAVFGLSKCEKFKKQILNYEKQYNVMTYELYGYKNQLLLKEEVRNSYDGLKRSNLLPQMWKLAYNNQNCLTNTQKDYLPVLKEMSYFNIVDIDVGVYYKKSPYCKKATNFLKAECLFSDDDKIGQVFSLASIFDQ